MARRVDRLLEDIRQIDTEELVGSGGFEAELRRLDHACQAITEELELGYFTTLRPASAPITAAPGAGLVPQ